MAGLFHMKLRALRRDRAAQKGVELFLHEGAFQDCLERIALQQRRFAHALLIGCPDKEWPRRLAALADTVDVRDPGPAIARMAGGSEIIEDYWEPSEAAYDLVLTIGTLDTVNDLRLAMRLIRHGMTDDALFIGSMSGGDTLPELRAAMRAADAKAGAAAPHVHPRIAAAALAPLLTEAGFINPVVDVERVPVSYRSFDQLVADLRAMAATNVLFARPRFIGKEALAAARRAFAAAGNNKRTIETFEILNFAAWTARKQ